MSEIVDLKKDFHTITRCPVLVSDDDQDYIPCNAILEVVVITTVRGDDYGSWTEHNVEFMCGHTFRDMEVSLRNAEYV